MELDDDSRKDLMEAFADLQTEIETCLLSLLNDWDKGEINRLFRAIHNIKGNAGLMGLPIIVNFAHEVEEVVGAMRQGNFRLSEPLVEALLIALDRLHDLHQQELYGKQFDHLRIEELQTLYRAMSVSGDDEAEGIAQQILQILGAGLADADIDLFATPSSETTNAAIPNSELGSEKSFSDLLFFQEIALQLDNQLEEWKGRSIQLFEWAMKINALAGGPINEQQFTAAIYMHDIGMSFIPREQWGEQLDLVPSEDDAIFQHAEWAYNYLIRVPGWEEAATIVQQHHEHVNGSGYPRGLSGEEIHPGAKILAILDAFFQLTNGRVDSSARRSTVRAISSINARINTEFEGMWVQCFNHVLREELKNGRV